MTIPVPPSTPRQAVRSDELAERFDPAGLDAVSPEEANPDDAPPRTGQPAVDRALHGLVGLGSEPLARHPDRLARAHEALHAELQDPPRDDSSG